MKKIALKMLLLGCLFNLSSCTEGRTKSPEASATPQASSTVSVVATPATGSGSSSSSGTGGSGSSTGSSSHSQNRGNITPRPGKTPEIKSTPQVPNLTPSEWRKKNFKPRPFKDFAHLSGYSVVRASSPQPATQTTIRSGKKIYEKSCFYCHGLRGAPPRRDAALVRYNMADLSQPQQYKYGSGDKALFRSIAYGVDSPAMPPFDEVYTKQEIWDLVNYIRTLQK